MSHSHSPGAAPSSQRTHVPSALNGWKSITDQPAMYAECKTVDHSNWIFSAQGIANPIYVIVLAWFRVQLMDDKALRPMFYGSDCTLCKDAATWSIMRSKMDN